MNWLAFNHANKRGCILADEMGLGKTCQTVSFVQHIHNSTYNNIHKKRPCLVVAPLSTLGHWKNEFERWTDLNCVIYHDQGGNGLSGADARGLIRENEFYLFSDKAKKETQSKRKRQQQQQQQKGQNSLYVERTTIPNVWKFDVLVTSYEVLVADADHLSNIHFASVIVDEGQRLKSSTSKLAKTFYNQIKSDTRVLLSGTPPLQNNIKELW